MNFPGEDIILL